MPLQNSTNTQTRSPRRDVKNVVGRHSGNRGEGLSTLTPRVNDSSALNRVLRESARQSPERQLLRRRLEERGLRENEVDGDGNCQFRAIADQLYSSSDRYAEVRTDIVEHLRSNSSRYSAFLPESYDAYIENMGRDGTWGDHVTLQAASNLYGLEIRVYTSYDENWERVIRPTDNCNVRRAIQLSFYAELHYNSVYPNTEFDSDDLRNLRPEEEFDVEQELEAMMKAEEEMMERDQGYAGGRGEMMGRALPLDIEQAEQAKKDKEGTASAKKARAEKLKEEKRRRVQETVASIKARKEAALEKIRQKQRGEAALSNSSDDSDSDSSSLSKHSSDSSSSSSLSSSSESMGKRRNRTKQTKKETAAVKKKEEVPAKKTGKKKRILRKKKDGGEDGGAIANDATIPATANSPFRPKLFDQSSSDEEGAEKPTRQRREIKGMASDSE